MSRDLTNKPSKGILKSSRSLDTNDDYPSTSTKSKELRQRFDEKNILETYHPANKDYGHMKIDEPKTPFPESSDRMIEPGDELDANILAAKLAASMNKPPKFMEADEEEYKPNETAEEREKRLKFEQKRKKHYNEYQAMKLAKKLMEDDESDDTSSDKSISQS